MKTDSTEMYQKHIKSNIDQLDQRKNKFIHQRIQFLKEFCQPVQKKIDLIKQEIKKYQFMRDSQEEVIQNQPSIRSLKEQIANYECTKQYFSQKVNQYQQKSIEYEQYNHNLNKQIIIFKTGVKNHQKQLGFQLPFVSKKRINSLHSNSSETTPIENKSFALPSIRHSIHSDGDNNLKQSMVRPYPKKVFKIEDKIQRFLSFSRPDRQKPLSASSIQEDPKESSEQVSRGRKKIQELRERITQFNRNQTLFQDCFETKKNAVQKSVSQLQSKLISNRQQFLNTCHAISSKQNKISYQDFKKLTSDEVITLFISFVWLNKKVKSQFVEKRKVIMQFIGKLPKIEQI